MLRALKMKCFREKKNPQQKNHQKDNTEAFLSKRWDDEGQGTNTRLDQR